MKNKLEHQKIIHLSKIDSSNNYAWKYWEEYNPKEQIVIWADEQTQGRGMRGNIWLAKAGENLTFSLILGQNINIKTPIFALSQIVSLALYETVNHLKIRNLALKWPNDLYMDGKKIAGILIENKWTNNQIRATVIGIGLNINQKTFEWTTAGSLYQQLGKENNIKDILYLFLEKWGFWLKMYQENNIHTIREKYLEKLMFYQIFQLYFIEKTQSYRYLKIIDVGLDGLLYVLDKEEKIEKYQFKELSPVI
jgi:BirA family biotin operon repressor/biotin-[acetyl-CoA-carboxylase] ligase